MKRRKERESQSVKLEEDKEGTDSSFVVASSSDDEEANEDLTLKIEQKAQRLRHARLLQNAAVSPAENGDIAMKKNKTKAMKIESGDQSVSIISMLSIIYNYKYKITFPNLFRLSMLVELLINTCCYQFIYLCPHSPSACYYRYALLGLIWEKFVQN